MKIPKRKKRRIWLAGLLSLFFPGLGQIYCGRLMRGICLTVILYLVSSAGMDILSFLPASSIALGFYLVFLFLPFITLSVDASIVAAKTSKRYQLKEYNRWYLYLCFIFVLSGFQRDCKRRTIDVYIQQEKCLSSSMFPTLQAKDRIILYKNHLNNLDPQVGDLIQFHNNRISEYPIIKRIIACEGDTVEIRDNQVIINDTPLIQTFVKETYHLNTDLTSPESNTSSVHGKILMEQNRNISYPIFLSNDPNTPPWLVNSNKLKVPSAHVYVMGDNRHSSYDSRDISLGCIPLDAIEGRAQYLIWPSNNWKRWGLLSPPQKQR